MLEVGPGPGRFSPLLGDPAHPRVLLDLSRLALGEAARHLSGRPEREIGRTDLVRGDLRRSPFRVGAFSEISLLGNILGFAGTEWERLLASAVELLRPRGELLVEVVAGGGESSEYLHRLPPGAVRRLLTAPPKLVVERIEREGFRALGRPAHRPTGYFTRFAPDLLRRELSASGLELTEAVAVAPAMGAEAERLESVRNDPKAWAHLLEVEEALGCSAARQEEAAAILMAARRLP